MTTLFRCVIATALAVICLAAVVPALADIDRERAKQLSREINRRWDAVDSLHKEGKYAEAFAEMERLESALDADEDLWSALLTDSLSEEEFYQLAGSLAYGRLSHLRRDLADLYLRHGCYQRAAAVADRQLALIRKVRDHQTFEEYMLFLQSAGKAAVGLGQLDKAIEYEELILDFFRRMPAERDLIPLALQRLALLYMKAGRVDRARELVAEARAGYEELWRDKPPTDLARRSKEATFLLIEGRYDEASALLKDIIAVELEQQEPKRGWIGWSYTRLAMIHRKLGQVDEEISVLKAGLRYQKEAKQPNLRYVLGAARQLATALRKAGRMDEANALREKYRLCFE